jgi:AbiU2
MSTQAGSPAFFVAHQRGASKVMIPSLSAEQQEVFDRLQEEISQAHYRWSCFKQIFVFDGEHRERHEARYGLMTQLAPLFFLELREMLSDSVFLQLCRVTEKTEQKVKGVLEENVVIADSKDCVAAWLLLFGDGTRSGISVS